MNGEDRDPERKERNNVIDREEMQGKICVFVLPTKQVRRGGRRMSDWHQRLPPYIVRHGTYGDFVVEKFQYRCVTSQL